MEWTSAALIIVSIIVLSVSIGVVLYNKYKLNKILNHLYDMLESAISSDFTETTYDESKMSALEVKLHQYLWESETSSKNLEKEKEKINSLISDISHQTKTPLANILLYSQLLLENNLSQEAEQCADQIMTQTEKLNFLIDSLIKTSRLENGIITVLPKMNKISSLLDTIRKQVIAQADNKHITFFIEQTQEEAFFDMKWTMEAIVNIVDNAIKYTPDSGRIIIKTTTYELFCRIDIADNGIGIDKSEFNKVFTRFYRLQAVTEQEGVGIGLYLAQAILLAEGGYIKVASKVGEGSVFSVFLPRYN
jgi:signal transduction histidine kinase